MDPIASKIVHSSSVKLDNAGTESSAKQFGKHGPSKFAQIREQGSMSGDSRPVGSARAPEGITAGFRANAAKLDQLTQRVAALPKTAAFDSIRSRLAELDSEYRRVGSTIDGISGSSSPQQLLNLQKDIYQMSENIGLVSKIVDQLTSGVKTVLQTQV
jgi:hypothetical protein